MDRYANMVADVAAGGQLHNVHLVNLQNPHLGRILRPSGIL